VSDGEATKGTVVEVTSEELAGFRDKLETWAKTLPEKEQMIAQALVVPLHDEGNDVGGFGFSIGFGATVPTTTTTATTVRDDWYQSAHLGQRPIIVRK
jgi:hypothetical protein